MGASAGCSGAGREARRDVGLFAHSQRNDHKQATPPALGGLGVQFDFGGFYQPVEPAPALNEVKAGSAVPVKFSLGGDQGLDVIAEGYPASQGVDCQTRDATGPLEVAEQPGQTELSYAQGNGWYSIVWKTEKAWAGGCRLLVIRLVDDTAHGAFFSFSVGDTRHAREDLTGFSKPVRSGTSSTDPTKEDPCPANTSP